MNRSAHSKGPSRLAMAIVALAAGCGDAGDTPTYPLTGTVTLSGQPISGALVQFLPAAADGASIGLGGGQAQTDSEGRFEAHAVRAQGKQVQHGLPAGEYIVTVVKMEAPAGEASLSKPPKNVLPPKYATQNSPLRVTVKADQENTADLKL